MAGDGGVSLRPDRCEQSDDSAFVDFIPCIQLELEWRPFKPPPERTSMYALLSLHSISIAVIDSDRARNLLQLSVSDVDLRHAQGRKQNRTSATVNWIQLDNMLKSAETPVLLSPSPMKHPQPTLQISVVENSAEGAGGSNLNGTTGSDRNFEMVSMLLQELDLSLEERWIVAVWDFVDTLMMTEESATEGESVKSSLNSWDDR